MDAQPTAFNNKYMNVYYRFIVIIIFYWCLQWIYYGVTYVVYHLFNWRIVID